MKMPTTKGWIAIAGALAAAILTLWAALADGTVTTEEADAVKKDIGVLVDTVQTETAEDTP